VKSLQNKLEFGTLDMRVRSRYLHLLIFVSCLCLPVAVLAQGKKSGETVYKEVCFACHATGVQNAPKFGDKAAWVPLFKEGQHVVTAHGWVGQRGMPPRGGRIDLSIEEFGRAVAYMARASGGNWKDPDAAMLERIRIEEKKRIVELKAKK
jgi:cytochrome c5